MGECEIVVWVKWPLIVSGISGEVGPRWRTHGNPPHRTAPFALLTTATFLPNFFKQLFFGQRKHCFCVSLGEVIISFFCQIIRQTFVSLAAVTVLAKTIPAPLVDRFMLKLHIST